MRKKKNMWLLNTLISSKYFVRVFYPKRNFKLSVSFFCAKWGRNFPNVASIKRFLRKDSTLSWVFRFCQIFTDISKINVAPFFGFVTLIFYTIFLDAYSLFIYSQ